MTLELPIDFLVELASLPLKVCPFNKGFASECIVPF